MDRRWVQVEALVEWTLEQEQADTRAASLSMQFVQLLDAYRRGDPAANEGELLGLAEQAIRAKIAAGHWPPVDAATITSTGNTKMCGWCGERLSGRQRLYCSNRCTVAAHRFRERTREFEALPVQDDEAAGPEWPLCDWCLEEIYRARPGQRWCSAKCKQAGWRNGLADETPKTRARNAAGWARLHELAETIRRESITSPGNTESRRDA
jgi:hypothetical protein